MLTLLALSVIDANGAEAFHRALDNTCVIVELTQTHVFEQVQLETGTYVENAMASFGRVTDAFGRFNEDLAGS
jgi:hypothetical protein